MLRRLKSINSKTKGINAILEGKVVSSINEISWLSKIRSFLHRASSYIKVPTLFSQTHIVLFIFYHILIIGFLLYSFNSSEYQYDFPSYLQATWINYHKFILLWYKVKAFPSIFLNIKDIHSFYKIIGLSSLG